MGWALKLVTTLSVAMSTIGSAVAGVSSLVFSQIQTIESSSQYLVIVLAGVVVAVLGILTWVDSRIKTHIRTADEVKQIQHMFVIEEIKKLSDRVDKLWDEVHRRKE